MGRVLSPPGFLCDDSFSSSCAFLYRLLLGTSPRHSPRCGLSSWPHHIPTLRVASRPGYGLALLLVHLALGDICGLASWVSHEALFWHM